MQALQNWVLAGVVTAMGVILWWIVQKAVNSILNVLKEIREQLQQLNTNIVKHEQQIINLQERLHDIDKRVSNLESK